MSKTILITGASTGFGRDTAETLSRAGHTVFASMRDIEGRNREHAKALRERGIQVVELDVTNDESVDRAVESVIARAGRIDVVVNNAGIMAIGVTEAFSADQAKVMLNTNVVGPLRVSRAVLPHMREQGDGLIINIGSIVGRVVFPFFGTYGASKFALEALTDSLRYELSQLGIDVVLVQPSAYATPLLGKIQQPADVDRAAAYGTVGEIPSAMIQQFQAMLTGANAPNPHDVAEAIGKLVAQPTGEHPERVVVGASFGADTLNAYAADVQKQVIAALGLGHLATRVALPTTGT